MGSTFVRKLELLFQLEMPVSYTHLDVYKRQQHDHLGIGVDLLFQPAGRGVLPDIHRPQAFPIRSLQLVTAAVVHPIVQDEGCLLYTSQHRRH